MTHPYDLWALPHELDIQCPECGGQASFKFAAVVEIERVKDRAYFQNHRLFDYAHFETRHGQRWHGAIYYRDFGTESLANLDDLPEGYTPMNWNLSSGSPTTFRKDMGTLSCVTCCLRRKHKLTWPEEAFYQILYKGKALWAFNRECVIELDRYILSKERDHHQYKWSIFLFHIPSHFLQSKAREEVSKKLRRLLN